MSPSLVKVPAQSHSISLPANRQGALITHLRNALPSLKLEIATGPPKDDCISMKRDLDLVTQTHAPRRAPSSQFPGLSVCDHCHGLETELKTQSMARAPRPLHASYTSPTTDRRQLRKMQRGHDKACGLCTILIGGLEAFAAAIVDKETLKAFHTLDSIEYVQPLVEHRASIRLSSSNVRPSDQSLTLEMIEVTTVPLSGQNHKLSGTLSTARRDIPTQLDPSRAAAWTRLWLTECVQGHTACTKSTASSSMPTRVLDISTQRHGNITLVEHPKDVATYVALSYCWGTAEASLRTTSLSINEHKAGIELQRFPVMFRDAIQLCRALEIRYLWVDSLCVVQNSQDDWHAEAAKMAAVYSNALFTIAASSSRSPNESLFRSRWTSSEDFRKSPTVAQKPPQTLENGQGLFTSAENLGDVHHAPRLDQRLIYGPGSVQVSFEDRRFQIQPTDLLSHSIIRASAMVDGRAAPLATRAWAFQERMLSPRTLHFLPTELVWECDAGTRCECGDLEAETRSNTQKFVVAGLPHVGTLRERFSLSRLERPSTTRAELCYLWQDLVSQYTPLALSFESDRLAAFSGFAARFERASLGECIAGMWTGMLPSGLCWTPSLGDSTNRRCQEAITVAPTWSWASIPLSAGDVIHYRHAIGLPEMECPSFKVLHIYVQPKGKNPYGAIQHASLAVQALCIDCTISTNGMFYGHTNDTSSGDERNIATRGPVASFFLDSGNNLSQTTRVVVMSLGWQRGLILKGLTGKEDGAIAYQRLGIAFLADISKLAELRSLILI